MAQTRTKFRGWLSTDEDEIERRRERAQVEPLTLEALEAEHPVFGTFRAGSAEGSVYEVEIRSFTECDNSCGCPDYQVNGLGTCKHIEAVVARLGGKARRRASSPFIEIFLRRRGEHPQVRIQWPEGSGRSPLRPLLGRFFTAEGRLKGKPATALPSLARARFLAEVEAGRQTSMS